MRHHRDIIRGLIGVGALLAMLGPSAAFASEAEGMWNRDDGLGGVRITACGDALCGDITWLREANGPAYLGERVLYGMKQTAPNEWTGYAHNPEDGHDYSGTITVSGDHLMTRGCLFAGLLCKTVELTRAR